MFIELLLVFLNIQPHHSSIGNIYDYGAVRVGIPDSIPEYTLNTVYLEMYSFNLTTHSYY